ncbi:MAG: RNA 3'-terminal phosphate cyclase [Pirellulaceae bacterium]|nr:RNA 3'-terminal phosphate cyclase [Planctomycetales bacterium]
MTHPFVEIDGAQGEGGGQIIRSSLALSLVTGKPVRIANIRAGRERPGLMRQHLAAVRAAAEVGSAEMDGDAIGSRSLTFAPNGITPGSYHFAVGTAGSCTLVLQTVLPALMIASGPSELLLEGGTHNPWAPPYDFLEQAYFPQLHRMSVQVTSRLERHGFYPAGGGRFCVNVLPPSGELVPLQLDERGPIEHQKFTALVSNLPVAIAQREVDVAAKKLGWPRKWFEVRELNDAKGPGNIVMLTLRSASVCELFTGFGRQGVRAERVAEDAIDESRQYLAANVPVGKHLADQLLLPMAIAAWRDGVSSCFRTLPLSRHATTHIDIVRKFLDVTVEVKKEETAVRVVVTSTHR